MSSPVTEKHATSEEAHQEEADAVGGALAAIQKLVQVVDKHRDTNFALMQRAEVSAHVEPGEPLVYTLVLKSVDATGLMIGQCFWKFTYVEKGEIVFDPEEVDPKNII